MSRLLVLLICIDLCAAGIVANAATRAPTQIGIVAEGGVADDRVWLQFDQSDLRFAMETAGLSDQNAVAAAVSDSQETGRSLVVTYDAESGRFDPRTSTLTFQIRELSYKDHDFFGAVSAPPKLDRPNARARAEAALARAIALRASHDPDGARQALAEALALRSLTTPLQALAYKTRAGVAGGQALEFDAGPERDRLLVDELADVAAWRKVAPDDPRPVLVTGAVLAALGEYDESLKLYRQVLRRWPERTYWTLITIGAVHRTLGQYDQALAALDEIAARGAVPDGMAYHYHRGRTLMALNRFDDAIAEFTAGIAKQPDYPHAFLQRACAYAETGRLPAAVTDQMQGQEILLQDVDVTPRTRGAEQDRRRAADVLAELRSQMERDPTQRLQHLCIGYNDEDEARRARSPLLPPSERLRL